MGLTLLTKGYTGKGEVLGVKALVTSYSLTLNNNLIRSGATSNILNENKDKFDFLSLNPLHDCPFYEVSISVQLNTSLYNKIKDEITKYFRSPIKISFYDDSIKASISEYYFITNFSLSIQNQAVATATFNGISYSQTLNFSAEKWDNNNMNSSSDSNTLKGNNLMPYYKWSIKNDAYQKGQVQSFNLNFSQTITPKFGCGGSSSNQAPEPLIYVASPPTVTCDVTYALTTIPDSTDVETIEDYNNAKELKYRNLTIQYGDINNKLTLNRCYPDSFSPILGNYGSVNAFTITNTVYGKIEKE